MSTMVQDISVGLYLLVLLLFLTLWRADRRTIMAIPVPELGIAMLCKLNIQGGIIKINAIIIAKEKTILFMNIRKPE